MMIIMALIITMGACSSKQEKSNTDPQKEALKKAYPLDPSGKLNIRYIDGDTVFEKYNLAKDFREMATKLDNDFDQTRIHLNNDIANFENTMKQKYRNSPPSDKDMQNYQQMQQNANNKLEKLWDSNEIQKQQFHKQIQDSVNNFLNEYAIQNHYDMILIKQPESYFTPYMNPNLDVTDEVVNELNKRYTKVASKK
ncbi:MAG: OmpH family outer membrane protein [Muribaculaceae bacterium]|nr:OmpH family outer membrane protein [Muribaculaceae bacterium]